jgi:hypothetical protein
MSKESFLKQVAEIARRSGEMRQAIVTPMIDVDNKGLIQDHSHVERAIERGISGTIFEGVGKGAGTVARIAANSLIPYYRQYGEMPPDELLASVHQAIENGILYSQGEGPPDLVFESAPMNTTEGILLRDQMIAVILPVTLASITSRMVTHIPGAFERSEIFKVWRVAGSTFGDLTLGQKIDHRFNGQYSSMDQRHLVATASSAATPTEAGDFDFSTVVAFGVAYPLQKKSIRIYHDHNLVAVDDGNDALHGTFSVGGSTVTVTGTVDYVAGIIDPIFSIGPADGIEIHVGFDVNIEKNPALIPLINHEMDSRTLYPHENAITASTTLQALWALRREYQMNAENMSITALRNVLSADRDRKILRDLYFFSKGERAWSMSVPAGLYFQEHYETIRATLLEIDAVLMDRTGTSGLVGLVADTQSATLFKTMKEPFFTPAPNYRRIPQPHYVGRLFGMWDLYEDPQKSNYNCLCYAKGNGIGEAGYVAGDAIPPMPFKHSVQTDLVYRNTLWGRAYRDLQPFDGREYFMKLEIETD